MLEICSDYPRFALLTLRKKLDELSSSDELAEPSPDGQWIDVIVGMLAVQGHSRVRAHPYLFGRKRLYLRECPILLHQSEAANYESIVSQGLFPGGPDKYYSRGGGHRRWCVFGSLADGHGYFPNCSMIDGEPAVPYKFRSYGNVYCLSTYYIQVTMNIEIWRTDAWCAMIMGWIPPEAIPNAFDANSKECWHCDRSDTRSSMINAMTCQSCTLLPSTRNREMSASPKKRVLPTQLHPRAPTRCPSKTMALDPSLLWRFQTSLSLSRGGANRNMLRGLTSKLRRRSLSGEMAINVSESTSGHASKGV